MKAISKCCILTLIAVGMSSCAWYKEPEIMLDANASLDDSSLNESGPNTISTLKSKEDDGGEYADNGGNFDTTSFDNVT